MRETWRFRFGAVALGVLMLMPLVPTAPADASATQRDLPVVTLLDAPACDRLFERLIDLDRCAQTDLSPREITLPGRASAPLGAASTPPSSVLAAELVEAEIAEPATAPESAPVICPTFAIGDVLDDPNGDWDNDELTNAFELYNQLDPCSFDEPQLDSSTPVSAAAQQPISVPVENPADQVGATDASETIATVESEAASTLQSNDASEANAAISNPCPNYSSADVLSAPDADWDDDRASNAIEFYNQQDPCVFDNVMNDAIQALQPQTATDTPCPNFSAADVFADQAGDWDRDQASNGVEFFNSTNPCVFDSNGADLARAFETNEPDSATTPCPSYSLADVNADPTGDWDQDRSTNSFEFFNSLNPCEYQAPVEQDGDFTPPPVPGSPCPSFSVENVFDDPDGDWDNDDKTNVAEFYDNGNPCAFDANLTVGRPTATATPTPAPSPTPSPTAIVPDPVATPTPSSTPTPSPTAVSPDPVPTAESDVTPTPTPSPTAVTTDPVSTPDPAGTPTATPTPTVVDPTDPGATPTPDPVTPDPVTSPVPTPTPAGPTPEPTTSPAPAAAAVTWSVDGQGVATATADAAGWNHTLSMADGSIELVGPDGATSQDLAGVTSVVIAGGVADDTIRVDLAGGAFTVPVTFSGSVGTDTVQGPASDTDWTIDGYGSGSVVGVAFSGTEYLEGAADNQDTFIFEQNGALAGHVDGGPGGFDTLVTNGTYTTVINNPIAPDAGDVTVDGNVITYVGLEPVAIAGPQADFVFNLPDTFGITPPATDPVNQDHDGTPLPPNNPDVILRPFAADPSRLEIAGSTFEDTNFLIPTVGLTINGGAGIDTVTIEGMIDLGQAFLNISAEIIRITSALTPTSITTTGDIDLLADETDAGGIPLPAALTPFQDDIDKIVEDNTDIDFSLADPTATIELDGVSLTGANINLSATTTASPADLSDRFAISIANNTSEISVVDSALNATNGDVTLAAESTVSTKVTGNGGATTKGVDGAIAGAIVGSDATIAVSGTSDLDATGAVSLTSTNTVTAEVEGLAAAGAGSIGAGVGIAQIDQTTKTEVTATGATWNASSLLIRSLTTNDIDASSNVSDDGADASATGSPTPNDRTANNSKTGDGDLGLAGALTYVGLDAQTIASVNGDLTISTPGGSQVIEAGANHDAEATADGSTAAAGGAGLAAAIAIANTAAFTDAFLGGGAALTGDSVAVNANNGGGTGDNFKATATSGATGSADSVGIAGSLAAILSTGARAAHVADATVTGNLSLLTNSIGTDETTANAGATGAGFGASVALALINETSSSNLDDSATLVVNNGSVTATTTAERSSTTKAETGSMGGGVAIAPAVAITVSNLDATANRGSGSSATVAAGSFDATATQTGTATTTASGDIDGAASAAIGLAVALAFVDHKAVSDADGSLQSMGASASATANSTTTTAAIAGAGGEDEDATTDDANNPTNDVNGELTKQQTLANQAAANKGAKGTTGTAKPEGKTATGAITVGAAVALSMVEVAASSSLASTGSIDAGDGAVSFAALVNAITETKADASATGDGTNPAVGVAVAINFATVTSTASVAGTVAAGSLAINGNVADTSTHKALTTFGASGDGISAAVSLALNIAKITARAAIESSGNVTVAGGNVDIGSASTSASTAEAKPADPASANPGVGGAVALNIVTDFATAEIAADATLDFTTAVDVTVEATGTHTTTTTAEAGASSMGIALAAAVATTVTTISRAALIGSGVDAISLAGSLTIAGRAPPAGHTSTTTATGSATATNAAVGLALSLDLVEHTTTATLARSVTAGGNITVTSQGTSALTSTAIASVNGAPADGEAGAPNGAGADGSPADPEGSVDKDVAKQRTLANDLAQANTGSTTADEATGAGKTPKGKDAKGAITAAAAVAIIVADTSSTASIAAGIIIEATAGTVAVLAESDTDSATSATGEKATGDDNPSADGSAGTSPSIGAALALNSTTVVTSATVAATATAQSLDVDADMRDGGANGFAATALAGASSDGTAAAVSLAYLDAEVITTATITADATITTTDVISIDASSSSASTVEAKPKTPVAGTKFGVGAALALAIVTDTATVAIDGTIAASGSLAAAAQNGHDITTTAEAGAAGGLAVAPAVAITVATIEAEATATGSITSTGEVAITAMNAAMTNVIATTATGSASTTPDGKAAAGLSLALNTIEHAVTASVSGTVGASGLTVAAAGHVDATATSTASAAGAPGDGEEGAANDPADPDAAGDLKGQIDEQRTLAKEQAAEAEGSDAADETTGAGKTPDPKDKNGTLKVAAAVAVDIVSSTTSATVAAGAEVTVTGAAAVIATSNADLDATADGKTTDPADAETKDKAVGAAVAISDATVDTDAAVEGTISAGSLNVATAVADTNETTATATAGAGGTGVAAAVSLGMAIANVTATARLADGAEVTLTGADESNVVADSVSATTATSKPNADGSGSLGVGASLALSLVTDRATATIAATSLTTGAGVINVKATGGHAITTESEAGGASNGLSLVPSVAITAATVERLATTTGMTPLQIGDGGITFAAENAADLNDTITKSTGSASTSGSAAVGLSLGLALTDHSTQATIDRDISATGNVRSEATGRAKVETTSTAAVKGAPAEGADGSPQTDGSGDVDGQVDEQRTLATEQAVDNKPETGDEAGKDAKDSPKAKTSKGPITVAAAVAVNVSDAVASATILSTVTTTMGVTVRAAGLYDISAIADASASDGTGSTESGPSVGAAVAINLATVDTTATVTGTITSAALTIDSGMADSGTHQFGANAKSGAAGAGVSVAASLGLNVVNLTSRAAIEDSATITVTTDGDTSVQARSLANSTATAVPNKVAGPDASIGVGISVALNLITDRASAEIADATTDFSGGDEVRVVTTGGHMATTTAEAGAKGDVGLAPAVAITVSSVDRVARIAAGTNELTIGGALIVASRGPPDDVTTTTTTATGSATTGATAAAGISLALNLVDQSIAATIERDATAASVLIEAIGQQQTKAEAIASAKGAPADGTDGAPSNTDPDPDATDPAEGVDKQVKAERTLAQEQAADNAPAGSDEAGKDAKDSPSAKDTKGPLKVAAAIAVNIAESTTTATIAADATVTASGAAADDAVTVRSLANTDAEAIADGSTSDGEEVEAGKPSIGVAVAINLATVETTAEVQGTVNAPAVTIVADMIDGADGHQTSASATSGASGDGATIAVSLGLNIVNVTTLAEIADGATVTVTGGETKITASSVGDATAKAQPHDGVGGSGMLGVGLSVALNIINDVTTAQVAGAVDAGGDVTIQAGGGHGGETDAKAGASSAGVAIVPAVAITVSTVDRIARVAAGSGAVVVGGDLVVEVTAPDPATELTTMASGAAESLGGKAAAGVALALTIATHDSIAIIERDVDVTGAATVTAAGQSTSKSTAIASAKGAPADGEPGSPDADGADADGNTGVDKQAAEARKLGEEQAEDNKPAEGDAAGDGAEESPKAKDTKGPLKVAAAIAITLAETTSRASVATGVTATVGQALTIQSTADTDAEATSDGSTADGTNDNPDGEGGTSPSIGAAVAITRADVVNDATVDGTVVAGGLTISATTPGEHELGAQATSGAAGDGATVAVSLALTVANVTTTADLPEAANVTVTGDAAVTITAESNATTTTKALPHDGSGGSGEFGVGASVALSIVNDRAIAQIDATTIDLSAAGLVTLKAAGGHSTTTDAQAGTGTDGIALVPAVAISVSNVERLATVTGGPAALILGDGLTILAEAPTAEPMTTTTSAKGSAEAFGGSAAAGVALALSIITHDFSAIVDRDVNAQADVTVNATGASITESKSEASAKGAPADGEPGSPDADGADADGNTGVDKQAAEARDLAEEQSEDTKPADGEAATDGAEETRLLPRWRSQLPLAPPPPRSIPASPSHQRPTSSWVPKLTSMPRPTPMVQHRMVPSPRTKTAAPAHRSARR